MTVQVNPLYNYLVDNRQILYTEQKMLLCKTQNHLQKVYCVAFNLFCIIYVRAISDK